MLRVPCLAFVCAVYKSLGQELGYSRAELEPVEQSLRCALILTAAHLVELGEPGLRALALPPLVHKWLARYIDNSTAG